MNVERFKLAQEVSYESALEEIKNGKKETHWMWFIFPQIIGLGESETSEYYAIKSCEEALLYLEDEYLYNNLIKITEELLKHDNLSVTEIFGSIDALKLKSSMTLFSLVSDNNIFNDVLNKYFNGEKCEHTVNLINTFRRVLK